MTIKNSGTPLTVTEINVELARANTANFNIGDTEERALAAILSGQISFGDFYGKTREAKYTVTADIDRANIQSYFSPTDWSDTNSVKVFIIPRGKTVYSSVAGTAALRTGTGRGGLLRIENDGNVIGARGVPNSGTGGTALLIEQSGVTLSNTFQIYGGGGAGGVGGQGGQGYYDTAYTITEGPTYSGDSYYFYVPESGASGFYWGGTGNNGSDGTWSYGAGGYVETTTNGSGQYVQRYQIYRQRPSSYRTYTTGGAGGTGGYGAGGLNTAASAGAAGAAGGSYAGSGGYGGNGGTYGVNGSSGATGNTGNYTGGSGAGGGGLAGYGINYNGFTLTVTATGDIRGR